MDLKFSIACCNDIKFLKKRMWRIRAVYWWYGNGKLRRRRLPIRLICDLEDIYENGIKIVCFLRSCDIWFLLPTSKTKYLKFGKDILNNILFVFRSFYSNFFILCYSVNIAWLMVVCKICIYKILITFWKRELWLVKSRVSITVWKTWEVKGHTPHPPLVGQI